MHPDRTFLSSLLGALRSGHWPSLVAAWLHFEVSFVVWVLIGALGVFIAEDLHLSATQKGFMVAVPLLGGSMARIVLGVMTDRYGPRRTGTLSMLMVLAPLTWAWLAIRSFTDVLAIGLLLGIAGASFAVSLPLASRAYPIQHQGLAMGVAGSGNSGAILSIALAPLLASQYGWRQVFGLMIPLVAVVAAAFWLLTKDHAATQPLSSRTLWNLLHEPDAYWFCFFYAITFGGFVGFSSYLSIFFFDQYNISRIDAGWAAGACALAGSFARPVGGFIADRWGGLRVLSVLLPSAAVLTAGAAFLPPFFIILVILFLVMSCLGMGNGVIFQVVPQRFRNEIGRISGVIGAAGGLGGFLLPSALGFFKDMSGTFATGFTAYALVCLIAIPAAARLGWISLTGRKTAI